MSAVANIPETIDTLEERRTELEYKIADVKAQLEKAAAHRIATGEYADPDWYRRAKAAQRYAGIEHQELLRKIAAAKRNVRADSASTFEARFINAARVMLTPDEFRMILNAAQQAVGS